MPGVQRSDFSTNDPDLAYAYIAAAHGGSPRLAGMHPGETIRHRRQATDQLAIDQLTMPVVMSYEVDRTDVLIINTVYSGFLHRGGTGFDDRVGPGDVAVTSAPDRGGAGTIVSTEYQSVSIHVGLLTTVATNDPELDGHQPLGLITDAVLAPAAAAQWQQAVTFLEETTLGNPAVVDSPILVGVASRFLAATALTLFPTTVSRTPSVTDRRDAQPAALRRAVAHLEAHAGTDLSVVDLARAAGVSVRAVQLAFRRHLGTTPGDYLRRHRLELARQDLLAADPATTTVAAVGARWGFATPSRFAAHYRSRFGELPSRTLRSG